MLKLQWFILTQSNININQFYNDSNYNDEYLQFDIIEYILKLQWFICRILQARLTLPLYTFLFLAFHKTLFHNCFANVPLWKRPIKRLDIDRDAIRVIANDRYISESTRPRSRASRRARGHSPMATWRRKTWKHRRLLRS